MEVCGKERDQRCQNSSARAVGWLQCHLLTGKGWEGNRVGAVIHSVQDACLSSQEDAEDRVVCVSGAQGRMRLKM